jgi:hypothetical protein
MNMSWQAEYNKNIGILEVEFSGSPDIEELKEAVLFSLNLCMINQVTRVLADCSRLETSNDNSILKNYELGTFYESLRIEVVMKEAIILPESGKAASMMYFFETTARNRGFNVRVFPTREEALEWLLEIAAG